MKNAADVSQHSLAMPLLELQEDELGAVVGGREPQIDIKVLKDGTIVITIKPG